MTFIQLLLSNVCLHELTPSKIVLMLTGERWLNVKYEFSMQKAICRAWLNAPFCL